MPAEPSFLSLSIEKIKDSRSWNLHPYLPTSVPDSLFASIVEVGILHPPIVVQDNRNSYDIINGRKRIRCAELLGISDCLCAVLPEDTSAKTLLRFLLQDQIASSPLSLPEIATFLQMSRGHLDMKEAIDMLPDTSRPRKNPDQFLQLLELGDSILEKLHLGRLAEKIIPDLLLLRQEEQKKAVCLIDDLHLGANKQKRLIGLCRDIVLRENISFSSLLEERGIREIVKHPMMNIPQKTSRIFEILQKRCFPRSTEAKEVFQSQVRELLLPDTFTIIPSPFFERDEISLSIRFPDLERCKEALPLLKDLLIKDQAKR
jgi:ParB family transcriptional regulator, chromosome partitioning protein